jgi:hypothetical protein
MLTGEETGQQNAAFETHTARMEESIAANQAGARVTPLGFIDGYQTQRKIRITYDRTKDELEGAIGDIGLGIQLPRNAVIKKGWIDVVIPPTAAGSATLALKLVGASDVLAPLAKGSFAGQIDCVQDGAAANMLKLSDPKELTLTVAVSPLDTGKFHVYLEYDISDPA